MTDARSPTRALGAALRGPRPTDNAKAPANAAGALWKQKPDTGVDQTWPAFSRAVQQVSTSSRVTTYGSTLAFGRRSSM